jgi:hypothetical protein
LSDINDSKSSSKSTSANLQQQQHHQLTNSSTMPPPFALRALLAVATSNAYRLSKVWPSVKNHLQLVAVRWGGCSRCCWP